MQNKYIAFNTDMDKIIVTYLFLICQNLYFSQSIKGFSLPDSIKDKSYGQLEKSYKNNFRIDNAKARIYANSFLIKAKKNKNNLKLADGYLMLYRLSNDQSALAYLDSMRMVSEKMQNFDLLSDSYMYRGNYYYSEGRYSKALDNYLKARNYTKSTTETYHILNFNIGLLKLELKDYKQAIQLFLDYLQYLEKNKAERSLDYLSCTYALASTYSQINDLKSSEYYIQLGLKKNLQAKDGESESSLLLISGINDYKRKDYKASLKTLRFVSKLIKDNSYNPQNLAISEYYIGRILYKTNNENFLNAFEGVDSIITKTKNVTYELREMYPVLIDYYKKSENKEKQLFYIEHLLSVDSILHKNNNFLSTEINKKYDTPLLLKEKENLIKDLHSKNNTLFWLLGIGGVFFISLSFLYIQNRKKIKVYKSKADLLTQSTNNSSTEINKSVEKPTEIINVKKEKPKATLSDEILQQLNKQLDDFENKKGFLNKAINLDILSKELNSNRVYLSKSVNELKGKNFSQYLNELRIQFIVEELKKNKNLQKLTIVAIADEAGYNNAESFTSAFKKITGTLPSYFIKALQENKKAL